MRNLCLILFTLVVLSGCKTKPTIPADPLSSLYPAAMKPFYHGVASGDPLQDRIVIWSRITPERPVDTLTCTWQMATSSDFSQLQSSGTLQTGPWRDFTLKVDVANLAAGTTYFYRFICGKDTSLTGTTRTLPSQPTQTRLAVVSCSNWEFGYFNAYEQIAELQVDAVVHLGDYIYEYASGVYGDTTTGRKNLPKNELVTLNDYRLRYSQYHLDNGLRKLRSNTPLITIWDDHEVANNVYLQGAENHQQGEGDFNARVKAARQAYYEWIPIRDDSSHYRAFSFGSLADLIMLDERLTGRTQPAAEAGEISPQDSSRTMLGKKQLAWLRNQLKSSTAQWRIIGNQVVFSAINLATISPKSPVNLDAWDGYPFEREILKTDLVSGKYDNVVFLTGDTHSAWASTIQLTPSLRAYEVGTTSVSSGNGDEYQPVDSVKQTESRLLKANPHLEFYNNRDHGFTLLEIQPEEIRVSWYKVNTLRKSDPGVTLEVKRIITKSKGFTSAP